MANRNSVLDFKRPHTLKEVAALWFVNDVMGHPTAKGYYCFLERPYYWKDENDIMGGYRNIHAHSLRYLIQMLDEVTMFDVNDEENGFVEVVK